MTSWLTISRIVNWQVGLVLTVSLLAHRPPASAQDAPPAKSEKADVTEALFKGERLDTASCSATGCHGGSGKFGARGSEYTSWVLNDPHTSAYKVLFNEVSRTIAKNLSPRLGGKPAHEAQVCLDCHGSGPGAIKRDPVTKKEQPLSPQAVASMIAFGIGCEGCHGTAERWIGPHTAFTWNNLDSIERAKQGMTDTKSLAGRARTCGQCHLGAADREVNHDLIAAGHPRLNFEFATFHGMLPHHWRDYATPEEKAVDPYVEHDKDRWPDFEARAWKVGQLVNAELSARLLEVRAKGGEFPDGTVRPWPEFTEIDCFACHHDLTLLRSQDLSKDKDFMKSWRQWAEWHRLENERQSGKAVEPQLGRFPWSNWTTATLKISGADAELDEQLRELRNLLGKFGGAGQPRDKIAEQARVLTDKLRKLADQAEQDSVADSKRLKKLISQLSSPDYAEAISSWDQASQAALGIQAMVFALDDLNARDKSAPSPVTQSQRAALQSLFDSLAFESDNDTRWNSPRLFPPEKVKENLESVMKEFGDGR